MLWLLFLLLIAAVIGVTWVMAYRHDTDPNYEPPPLWKKLKPFLLRFFELVYEHRELLWKIAIAIVGVVILYFVLTEAPWLIVILLGMLAFLYWTRNKHRRL